MYGELQTWPIESRQAAERFAEVFKTSMASEAGWRDVQVKQLTEGQLDASIARARSHSKEMPLPPAFRRLVWS